MSSTMGHRPFQVFPHVRGGLVPMAAVLVAAAAGACAARQDARPPASPDQPPRVDANGRRVLEGTTKLAFKNAKISDVVSFIVEATGKVVMPQSDVMSRPFTLIGDGEIPRQQALDMVFLALHQAGVGVVETPHTITLRDITEIDRQDVPVIGPNESVLGRTDLGTMAEKIFTLSTSTAQNLGEVLKNAVPKYAKLTVDSESNRIAIMGNIAMLQRMERLITEIDTPSVAALKSATYRLRYGDASQIKTNIEDLFSSQTRTGGAGGNRGTQGRGGDTGGQNRFPFFPGQQQQQQGSAEASENLRVTANTQQNSVTVVAEPGILAQIAGLIESEWDQPLPDEAVIPKIYDLRNSDPVKVRDLLVGLFGSGTSGTGAAQPAGANRPAGSAPSAGQGVGRLQGQFSFEAIPDSGRLVVVAKSPDNIAVIDRIIEELDRPQSVGLPSFIELKHASAEELAEQLNALLAQDGTLAQIPRAETGLSEGSSTASPFATDQQTQANQETVAANAMGFWWQRSRPPTDSRGPSNLIAQVRIVPVWRQNALLVLSAPEYRESIVSLIEDLDRPGRQVLISAIIAEVSADDALSLGLRWSSQAITPTNADNAISIGTDSATSGFISSLFNSSVLDVNMDVNVILQALAQKTRTNILSEPKVFTADNQEAEFFDGQDIPFVTDTQTTDAGNQINSFDYRAVGIQLRARPRITMDKKVDLRVNLELSSIVPGQTLFGAFIVERRETTTQTIIRNGQTVVISGILRHEEVEVTRKVPFLGDVPLLGHLFRSKDNSAVATELMVFITPIIVDNVDETDAVTAPLRGPLDRLRDRFKVESEGDKIAPVEPSPPAPDPDVGAEG